MSERGRGRARGRAGRGGENAGPPPRRPGEQQGPQQQQPGPLGPRPQPPTAWGPPTVAPPVRAGVPTPTVQAGRASHRITPTTHQDHPGDVDVQQRMQSMQIGKTFCSTLLSVFCLIRRYNNKYNAPLSRTSSTKCCWRRLCYRTWFTSWRRQNTT